MEPRLFVILSGWRKTSAYSHIVEADRRLAFANQFARHRHVGTMAEKRTPRQPNPERLTRCRYLWQSASPCRLNKHRKQPSWNKSPASLRDLFEGLESAVEKMNTPPVKRGKPARCHSLVQPKSAMIKPTYQTSQTVYKKKAPRRKSKLWQGAFRMSLPKKGCGFPIPIKKFSYEMRRNKKPRQASLKSTWRGMYTNVPLPVGTLMPTPWNSRSIIPT